LVSWVLGALKIQIFCRRCSFCLLNMRAKNREKVQHLGHFSGLALRIFFWFCTVRSKNQNKLRLSRNTTKLYRHLYKNTSRVFAKIRSISNKSKFLLFFQAKHAKSQLMLCQDPNLSAIELVVVICIRKDWTVTNYR